MKQKVLIVLTVLALTFIWGNSLLSYQASDRVSEAVVETVVKPVQQAATGEATAQNEPVRKWAHAVEFAVLSLLLGMLLREKKYGVLLAGNAALLAAFLDETIQLLRGRGDRISDVWIDLAGAAVGIGAAWLLGTLLAGRKHE